MEPLKKKPVLQSSVLLLVFIHLPPCFTSGSPPRIPSLLLQLLPLGTAAWTSLNINIGTLQPVHPPNAPPLQCHVRLPPGTSKQTSTNKPFNTATFQPQSLWMYSPLNLDSLLLQSQ
ncbi:hypothetical protein AMECASPLE_029682 [Ameca splendens]|uniref:Uncharacterized protein n=1 Tax=Ameca splendens TaxID=208324 RepID=A0ABV0YGY8_9TELE